MLFEQDNQNGVHEFRFEFAGNPASRILPNTRMWFAFWFQSASNVIHSYYWDESFAGQSALTSFQSVPSALLTAGNVGPRNAGSPIRIGSQDAIGATDVGFNGVVGELRFYQDGANSAPDLFPTFNQNYPFYQRELTDDEITNQITGTDMDLYVSLNAERVRDVEYLDPRYTNGAAGTSVCWLTGGNAAWVSMPSGSKLGKHALQLYPSVDHYRALVFHEDFGSPTEQSQFGSGAIGAGVHLYGRGIRVLNGDQYVDRDQDSFDTREYPPAFSGVIAFKTEAVLPTNWKQRQYLFSDMRVLRGNAIDHDYRVRVHVSVFIEVDGSSNHRFKVQVATSTGTAVFLESTTLMAADTEYTIGFSTQFGFGTTNQQVWAALYVDGVLEDQDYSQDSSPGSDTDVPPVSQTTSSTPDG